MEKAEKLLTIKCDSKRQKQARKLLNAIKKKTAESHILILIRALNTINRSGKIDY